MRDSLRQEKEEYSDGIVLDRSKRLVFLDGKAVKLTATEFRLFVFLMENEGKVISRNDFLSKVWDYEYAGVSRTLDVHISTLRKKLGHYGKRILTVRKAGYLMKRDN